VLFVPLFSDFQVRKKEEKKRMEANRFRKAANRKFGGLDQQEWRGEFFFVQMADTQLGFMDEESTGGITWETELELLDKAVKKINIMKPKFVILCGDVIHSYPPSANFKAVFTSPELYARQLSDFKEHMNQIDLDIPLICLCGNHDVGNRPTLDTIKEWGTHFGDDYFSFWIGGIKCIILNGIQ
jgi:hypothetical protein